MVETLQHDQCFLRALTLLCVFAFLVAPLHAEPQQMSPAQQHEKTVHPFESLKTEPSHVVVGTVGKVYTSVSSAGSWRTTKCVAELKISEVSKGKGISVFDSISVKYFYKDWIGKGPAPETQWTGQRGHKVGSLVRVSLFEGGSGSGVFDVCMPDGFSILDAQEQQKKWSIYTVQAPGMSDGFSIFETQKQQEKWPIYKAQDVGNRARLIVKNVVLPGDNRTTYELKIGDQTFSGSVDHSYNLPTGHSSSVGSLGSIIEEVTGTTPESPDAYKTIDAILPVLDKNGWSVDGDTTWAHDKPPMSTIRIVDLRRKTGG